MNIYYAFYCRAYDWYNTTGKESKDTLRVSAIALLSAIPTFQIISIIYLISKFKNNEFKNQWTGIAIFLLLSFLNYKIINSKKSDLLRKEYLLWILNKKKKVTLFFYFIITASILLFILALIFTGA